MLAWHRALSLMNLSIIMRNSLDYANKNQEEKHNRHFIRNIFVSNTSGDEGVIVCVWCVYSCVLSLRQWGLQRRRRETAHWDLGWCPQQSWPPFPPLLFIVIPHLFSCLLSISSCWPTQARRGEDYSGLRSVPKSCQSSSLLANWAKKSGEKRVALVDFLVYTDLSWYIADWLSQMTLWPYSHITKGTSFWHLFF